MGLAPYGEPKYKKLITDNLIDIKDDGSFKLDQSFFEYSTGLKMISERFSKLFGNKPRNPEKEKLTQFHMDIASSIQEVTEDVMLRITNSLAKEYNIKNLCLAGGVALNCVANGKILRSGKFKNIWIQPAAGDAGGSLGAAIGLWHIELKKNRTINSKDDMNGSYLGPEYSNSEIEKQLKEAGANFEILEDASMIRKAGIF